ncbi:MAG: Holliday junction branch migration protein RuvA [Firmicutes bacterium]|nr:Holliday junction branch migration protein RuvA [Bacillota bacterium]
MYYYISGKIVHKDTGAVAIDANGVAYYIKTTLTSLAEIGESGTLATMYTYLSVREDAMELYGFATKEEKAMYMMLISVSGVGPKAALAVLSVLKPAEVAAAIVTNDQKALTKAQGVGAKAAQRIILELKDKINADELDIPADTAYESGSGSGIEEAVGALVALGYSLNDAKAAVKGIDSSLAVEEIIKKALANLF